MQLREQITTGGAFLVALLLLPAILTAQDTELLRGKVVDTQKKPLAGVDVVVTGQLNGVVQRTVTDAKGAYTVAFRDPEGTYQLAFRKIGYGAYTRTAHRTGLVSIIDLPDAVLPGGINVLQPLVATTMRKVPTRGEIPSVGSIELNTINGALFVADPSDLNALAELLPGIMSAGDSGYSILGASPGQNRVLVDGSDFSGTSLPRDAIGRSKVVVNTFDASKGEFAGAATVVSTRQGPDYFASTLRAQLIDPHLAWGNPSDPDPVPQIGYASGYVAGPIVKRRLNFMAAFDGRVERDALGSLLAPRPDRLAQLGISSDTVAAARATLERMGIPLLAAGAPADPLIEAGSASLRLDYRASSATTYTFTAIGNFRSNAGAGITELGYPSASATSSSSLVRYKFAAGTYVHRILEDFGLSLTPQRSRTTPYLETPSGVVLVGTGYSDGRTSLSALRFGGAGFGASGNNGDSWDATNELSWATPDTRNQIKFTQELRVDWGQSEQVVDPYGVFSYQSLADLDANHPSSFSRALSTVSLAYHSTIAAVSLGDVWRVVPGVFDLQGGARFDSRTFATRPGYNHEVDSLFGARTDVVPSDQGISPRLGFSWRPGARRNTKLPDGMMLLTPGAAVTARGSLSPLDAAGVALLAAGSDVTVSGGIGAYRGTISPARIGALDDATGLPQTTRYLSCVGAATPVPDWSAPVAINSCVDGSGTSAFGSLAPRVTFFDPHFAAPLSWRANVQLTGWRLGSWPVAPQLTFAEGTNVESWVDLNLRRTAAFTLSNEASRPVYGDATAIVPSTGVFGPGSSRLAPAFGEIREVMSDLGYHTTQLTVATAVPKPLFGSVPLYLIYSLNLQRREQLGFNGTTAGDPFARESVDGQQSKHQFIVGASNIHLGWLTAALRLNILSSTPYTPMVAGDINGDGLANDRAFIANPATVATPPLARELTTLLASAPAGARGCLQAQLGTIAAANSCHTPWQARLDLNLGVAPPQSLGTGSRVHLTARLLNVSGALVRLFGLQNTPLGQSAGGVAVDSRLLYVSGFDPVTRQFQYRVNQLFGQPLDYGAVGHSYPPFELQLGVEYRLGYPSTAQTARNIGAFPNGKDSAAMAATVRIELLRRISTNPVTPILELRDSLDLTAEQIASIEKIRRELVAATDSVVAPAVAFFVHRGRKLNSDEYNGRVTMVAPSVRALDASALQQATAYLLPEQRIKLVTLTAPGRKMP